MLDQCRLIVYPAILTIFKHEYFMELDYITLEMGGMGSYIYHHLPCSLECVFRSTVHTDVQIGSVGNYYSQPVNKGFYGVDILGFRLGYQRR